MAQRSRMVKTLAFLAVSMTVGAGVLTWFEPVPPFARQVLGQPIPLPAQVVDFSTSDNSMNQGPLNQWKGIRLHYVVDSSAARPAIRLQAKRSVSALPETDCHFQIDANGTIYIRSAWRNQRPLSPHPDLIAIAVVGDTTDRRVPSRQWRALTRLVDELRRRCRIAPQDVKLDPASDPTKCPDLPAQAHSLRQRLADVGIIAQLSAR